MIVVVHHRQHYDWEPIPKGVELSEAEKTSDHVKPAANGGWLMRVTKYIDSHTTIQIPESNIVHTLFHRDVRGLKLTRKQAVALHISQYVLPHHTHPRWVTDIAVHDDGPDETVARALLAPHTVSEVARVAACTDAGTHDAVAHRACASCSHSGDADLSEHALIDSADLEAHVAAYLEHTGSTNEEHSKAHAAHLLSHFKVRKAVAS